MNSYVTIGIAQDGIFLGTSGKNIFFSDGFLGTTTCAGEVGSACSRGLDSQQIKLQMLIHLVLCPDVFMYLFGIFAYFFSISMLWDQNS